jgi:receptor expression-enhancing protein 5/6
MPKDCIVARSQLPLTQVLFAVIEKVKVPKEHLVVGALVVATVVVFLGVSMPLVVNVVGFGPPAVFALQSHFASNSAQEAAYLRKNWMSYFVLSSMFNVLETYRATLLSVFKYYYAFKLAILVWAMSPQWRGAAFILDYVRPHLKFLHVDGSKRAN